jgi:hypothetical protein
MSNITNLVHYDRSSSVCKVQESGSFDSPVSP